MLSEDTIKEAKGLMYSFKDDIHVIKKFGEEIKWTKLEPREPSRIVAFDSGYQRTNLLASFFYLKIRVGVYDTEGILTESRDLEERFQVPGTGAASSLYASVSGMRAMWASVKSVLDSVDEGLIMIDGPLGVAPEPFSPYLKKNLEPRFKRRWYAYEEVYRDLVRLIRDSLMEIREKRGLYIVGVNKNTSGKFLLNIRGYMEGEFLRDDVTPISLMFERGEVSVPFPVYPEKESDGEPWFDESRMGKWRNALVYLVEKISREEGFEDPLRIAYETVQRRSVYLKTMDYYIPPIRLEFPAWYSDEDIERAAAMVLADVEEGEKIPNSLLMADLLSRVREDEGKGSLRALIDAIIALSEDEDERRLADLLLLGAVGRDLSHVLG